MKKLFVFGVLLLGLVASSMAQHPLWTNLISYSATGGLSSSLHSNGGETLAAAYAKIHFGEWPIGYKEEHDVSGKGTFVYTAETLAGTPYDAVKFTYTVSEKAWGWTKAIQKDMPAGIVEASASTGAGGLAHGFCSTIIQFLNNDANFNTAEFVHGPYTVYKPFVLGGYPFVVKKATWTLQSPTMRANVWAQMSAPPRAWEPPDPTVMFLEGYSVAKWKYTLVSAQLAMMPDDGDEDSIGG